MAEAVLRKVKNLDYEKLKPALAKQDEIRKQYGFKIYLPSRTAVVLKKKPSRKAK